MNIFDALMPDSGEGNLSREEVQVLLTVNTLKIERIVSNGHASPKHFWYDQDRDEWTLLVSGTATLEFASGEMKALRAGDYVLIPAHVRHRVSEVSQDAVWLAVHFRE